MPFILEGLVTTQNSDGCINLAPMGPIVLQSEEGVIQQFLFRPFSDSQTCQNLLSHPQGVFHATDDVLLFAQAVTGNLPHVDDLVTPASKIQGVKLKQACHTFEFEVIEIDSSQPRLSMKAKVLHQQSGKFWRGFNRAQFAVIEAAISATRLHLIPQSQVSLQMEQLSVLIEKTAGDSEREAFLLIQEYISQTFSKSISGQNGQTQTSQKPEQEQHHQGRSR